MSQISWDPIVDLWPWWLVILALVCIITLVLEFRRSSRWPWLRRIASVLLWASLALWGLRPQYSQPAQAVRVAWVTEAFPDSLLQAFFRHHNIQEVWETEQGLVTPRQIPVQHVPDGYYRPSVHLDTLWVLGEGLPHAQARLDSATRWQPVSRQTLTGEATPPAPYFQYHYQQQQGLPISLSIQVDWPAEGGSLVWRGPSGTLDSVAGEGHQRLVHELSTFPTQAGRYLHQLEITTASDTLAYPLPFAIAPTEALDILLLSGFPTFEHRTLKNWLGEAGHRVAVRAQLAAERFRSEFINRAQTNLNRIQASTLAQFRLVIIDAPVLASLAPSEWQAIRKALDEGQVGLWIQLPADFDALSIPGNIRRHIFPAFRAGPASLTLDGKPYGGANKVEVATSPRQNASGSTTQNTPFVHWPEGVQRSIYLHRVYDTHQLALAGNQDFYRRYWSYHLTQAAAPYPTPVAWQPSFLPMFAQQPQITELVVSGDEIPRGVLLRDGEAPEPLPLVQNLYETERWQAHWQSATPGWVALALTQPTPDTLWAYVLPDTTYLELQRELRSQQYARASHSQATSAAAQAPLQSEPVPAFLWYVLALLCLTFLWAEPKL